ncbi:MAG: hypothetical protein ACQCN6_01550 [Candidatus Bathyarchaeia archaeon]
MKAKFKKIAEKQPCPRCNSKATSTVRYIGENFYMGDWLRCRSCGVHTQTYQPSLKNIIEIRHVQSETLKMPDDYVEEALEARREFDRRIERRHDAARAVRGY